MAMIRPCADLRNNYNEISQICHQTKQPIYITRNGYNDLVVLSNEAYENLSKQPLTEEEIDNLISEKFDKHYADFEEFKKDVWKNIEKALKEIEEGRYQSMEDFCAEMEAKYDIKM